MEKTYLQITSGRGPVECCRVVALVLERILKQAQTRKLKVEIVEKKPVLPTVHCCRQSLHLKVQVAIHWWKSGREPCCGLPVARTGFITDAKLVCRCADLLAVRKP